MSAGPCYDCHNFPEVVPIERASGALILEVLR
jgi:hypothetical protein